MSKTYTIITYGCQANISDSERMAGALESMGFKKSKKEEDSDILIYNACSVRKSPEDRIFGLNKKLKLLKIKNPKLKTALAGCILHYTEKELKTRLPHFDAFLSARDLISFKKTISEFFPAAQNKKKSKFKFETPFLPKYESSFRANVPISYGCNNFCSYCIVPYSRGREISRDPKEIINEVESLAARGYKEIWLLGQNVNNYTSETKGIENFAKLLRKINEIPGCFWLRFTSPHPKNFTNELIDAMAGSLKFPHYLNLPVQSGDNEILKKMNRPYTQEEYIILVKKIRKKIPDISLSTDTIVGFPGETEKQFQNTINLYKEIKFDMAYISEYSERPKTLAAKIFQDDIPKKEKTERKIRLTEILAATALLHNKNLTGKILDVLIDEEKKGKLFARNAGNKVVELVPKNHALKNKHKNLIGEFKKVKIISAGAWKLKGEII